MQPTDLLFMEEVQSLGAFGSDPDVMDPWSLAAERHSYAITTQENEVVACAGVVEHFDGYGTAWVAMADAARKHIVQLIGIIRRFLWLSHFRRIEATVDARFRDGHRLVKLLGFRKDCVLKRYSNTSDFVLYSIVKGGDLCPAR